MESIAIFVDDAGYAQHILQPMLDTAAAPTRWVVVACAPRLTYRVSKWLSHSTREHWRGKWADKVFAALGPSLRAQPGAVVETMIAKGPLSGVCERLRARWPELRVVDARRPKTGHPAEPLDSRQPPDGPGLACQIMVVSGLSLMLALAD